MLQHKMGLPVDKIAPKHFRRKGWDDTKIEEWFTKLTAVRREKLIVLFYEQDGKCFYCTRDTWHPSLDMVGPKRQRATLEHLIFKSMGGTDNRNNLRMACVRCNSQRGIMSVEEYRKKRGLP